MDVHDTVDLGEGHLIEFGQATWDAAQTSVRNRYPTSTGGFSPRSSSEIPITDIVPVAVETLRRDLLDIQQTMQILQAAVHSLHRRLQ